MKILVTIKVLPEHKAQLMAVSPNSEFIWMEPQAVTVDDIRDVDIVLGVIPKEFVEHAKQLKLLHLSMAGSDAYPVFMPKGVALTNSSGAFGLAISEHLLGMLFVLKKKLHLYRDNQLKSTWQQRGMVTSVEGANILYLGVGDIGGEFAKKCKALGAYNIGVRRNVTLDKPGYFDEMHTMQALDGLWPRADVIAMSLPGGESTKHIINRAVLDKMNPGTIVLNVGRGGAIDTEALTNAVASGKIFCGLDVTEPEPLPSDHRLWGMENALITPHVSGFYYLRQTHDRIVGIAAENLRRFIAGETLLNMVDHSTGYRQSEGRLTVDDIK